MINNPRKEVKVDINADFHKILKDLENIFWFFILSNKALSHPDIQNILRLEKDGTILSMLEKYNNWVGLNIEIKDDGVCTSKMNIEDQMVFMGKTIAILGYEYLWASEYKEIVKKDKGFLFLKYIRNGAAHDNKFDFKYKFGEKKGKWIMGENEIIKWNDKEISRKLQDTKVFNDFIWLADVFLLMRHFSEKLKQIDSTIKT